MLTLILAVLTFAGVGSMVVAASPTSTASGGGSGLLEVVTADSFIAFLQRHADTPHGTTTIPVDLLNWHPELTTAHGVRSYDTFRGRDNAVYLPNENAVTWTVTVPHSGLWSIELFYYAVQDETARRSPIERSLRINGDLPFREAAFITLNKTFTFDFTNQYGFREFPSDVNGNQMRPPTEVSPEWRPSSLVDSSGFFLTPLVFFFEEGENTITLGATREPVIIADMNLAPYSRPMSFEDYVAYYRGHGYDVVNIDDTKAELRSSARDDRWDLIQAQFPCAVSHAILYPTNDRTSSLTWPQSPNRIYLNSIGGNMTWTHVGQWVRYSIEIPESGFYRLSARFLQNTMGGSFVSRALRIQLPSQDYATTPFWEANFLRFPFRDDWQTSFLGDGENDFIFFFEEGTNYIELEANLGDMAEILRRVENSMHEINNAYIQILRLTGATPDRNRDYGIYRRIPGAVHALSYHGRVLAQVVDDIVEITGSAGSHTASLAAVSRHLIRMGTSERQLTIGIDPLRLQLGGLGRWMYQSTLSPLHLDYIEVHSGDATNDALGRARDNIFQRFWFEIRLFFASFFTDFSAFGLDEINPDIQSIEVWTTVGREQAQIIRDLITNDFVPNHNIAANLLLVAPGTLLPSVLAGVGPDVSLGHAAADVINWAIRNALTELTDFEGLDEIRTWFPEAAFIPLTLNELRTQEDIDFRASRLPSAERAEYRARYTQALDENGDIMPGLYRRASVWALPMEIHFPMMFYRVDIFHQLGLEPPRTWDDLHAVMGTLAGNNMEIGMPGMPNGMAMFYMFLHQYGGQVYADDGRRINFDCNISLSAWDTMSTLFQMYRFPTVFDGPNRFRTGQMPLLIADFTLFTTLSVFATEIRGMWEFVPLPGVMQEDGTIDNTSVASVTGAIMLRGARDRGTTSESWAFMRWFVSAENQANYANEITALIGTAARHNTANLYALQELPWTAEELNSLLSQMASLAAVPEYPGSYIIERYLRFAFNAVVAGDAEPVPELVNRVIAINRELTRRRREFNMAYFPVGIR